MEQSARRRVDRARPDYPAQLANRVSTVYNSDHMNRIDPSIKVLALLVGAVSVLAALNVFLPQGTFLPVDQLPASKPVVALASLAMTLFLYGALGALGLLFSRKIELPEIWDPNVASRQRFLTPAIAGALAGVVLIVGDSILSNYHDLGPLPHPPFPTSIVASLSAGIGEEIIFRLFFISFWTWLVSGVLLGGRGRSATFWVVAVFSAVAFAIGHLPSVMYLYGAEAIGQIPTVLFAEIMLLNGVVSLVAAYYFRRFGLIAAIGVHFWVDVVWHVIWGAIG